MAIARCSGGSEEPRLGTRYSLHPIAWKPVRVPRTYAAGSTLSHARFGLTLTLACVWMETLIWLINTQLAYIGTFNHALAPVCICADTRARDKAGTQKKRRPRPGDIALTGSQPACRRAARQLSLQSLCASPSRSGGLRRPAALAHLRTARAPSCELEIDSSYNSCDDAIACVASSLHDGLCAVSAFSGSVTDSRHAGLAAGPADDGQR